MIGVRRSGGQIAGIHFINSSLLQAQMTHDRCAFVN